jgi:hypothetical protein
MTARYLKTMRLRLFDLIPGPELHLPSSRRVLGRAERDQRLEQVFYDAVSGANPTRRDGARLLIELFDHVRFFLFERRTSRDSFWHRVAEEWEASSGVAVHAADVCDLVLAICRAERRFAGHRSPDPSTFLTLVRAVNEYLRQNESDSDEAMEFLEEVRIGKARNGERFFVPVVAGPIPWRETPAAAAAAPRPNAEATSGDSAAGPHESSRNVKRKQNDSMKKAQAKEAALLRYVTALFEAPDEDEAPKANTEGREGSEDVEMPDAEFQLCFRPRKLE